VEETSTSWHQMFEKIPNTPQRIYGDFNMVESQEYKEGEVPIWIRMNDAI